MVRPLHRGLSGGGIVESSRDYRDSQMKDGKEREEVDKCGYSSDHHSLFLRFVVSLVSPDGSSKSGISDSGFGSDPFSTGTYRSRTNLIFSYLKLGLFLIVILALSGSLWWTVSISTSSRGYIFRGYTRLQEQLISDLSDFGQLSLGPTRLKELEFCSQESENYVPCFNITDDLALGYSDGNEYDRHCGHGLRQSCLILPPMNYKIPLRWPTGRDVIWSANVKITAQEVLSSGSLTKRMMMLEEDQISFRSDSLMFDGVEDYSHQIAEMIGLRNESSFIQAGDYNLQLIHCGMILFAASISLICFHFLVKEGWHLYQMVEMDVQCIEKRAYCGKKWVNSHKRIRSMRLLECIFNG